MIDFEKFFQNRDYFIVFPRAKKVKRKVKKFAWKLQFFQRILLRARAKSVRRAPFAYFAVRDMKAGGTVLKKGLTNAYSAV